MQYIQELELDIFSQNTYRYINAKQADNITRFVKIAMTADGEKIKPEEGVTAYFRALKEDGKSVFNPATINEDGTVTVELTEQALACPGMVDADVSLMKGDEVLSVLSFRIQVEKAPVGKAVASDNEFLVLTEATKEAQKATEEAKAATEKANTAAKEADESRNKADEAEALRQAAEEGRDTAEKTRTQNEAGRVTAEEGRDTAEQGRVSAESDRAAAETTRQSNEEARESAEDDRAAAEAQRATDEDTRNDQEAARVAAEKVREQNEADRKANETARQEAESSRVEAEAGRVEEHEQMMKEAQEATEDAVDAATHPPIIQNGTWWIWSSESSAYEDTGWTARGNILYAAFFVDMVDGVLYMCTDDEYDGPDFRLTDDGYLEVVLYAGNGKE